VLSICSCTAPSDAHPFAMMSPSFYLFALLNLQQFAVFAVKRADICDWLPAALRCWQSAKGRSAGSASLFNYIIATHR